MSDTIQDYFERYGPAYRWIATITVMAAAITTVPRRASTWTRARH